MAGKKVGIHTGLINYTVGQRERLGIGGPKAYYVVKLNRRENSLIVGDENDLYHKKLIATDLNWIRPILANSKKLSAHSIGGRIRYGHPINSCKLLAVSPKQIKIIFDQPQRAITPGQSIVFYEEKEVLGGGIIAH